MSDIAELGIKVDSTSARKAIADLADLAKQGGATEVNVKKMALASGAAMVGFSSLAGMAANLGRAIVQTAQQSVQMAAAFETSRVTYGVMVQDVDRGTQVFESLIAFAARTPLAFAEIDKAAQTLMGFGVEADDLIDTLGRLGDVSRGNGEALGRLALVFGQVRAQGKAMTQDLYQFVNAGVPIFKALADEMGTTEGNIKDLAAEGKIGFAQIEGAIRRLTSEGGAYFGMMDKIAETTQGKWSTAQDNFKQYLAELGENLLPTVNAALDAFNKYMGERTGRKNVAEVLAGSAADAKAALDFLNKQIETGTKALDDYKNASWDAYQFDLKRGGFVFKPQLIADQKAYVDSLIAQKEAIQELIREQNRLAGAGGGKSPAEKKIEDQAALARKLAEEKEAAARREESRAKSVQQYMEDLAQEYKDLSLSEEEALEDKIFLLRATGAEAEAIRSLYREIRVLREARAEEAKAAEDAAAQRKADQADYEAEAGRVYMVNDLNDSIIQGLRDQTSTRRELHEERLREAGATEAEIEWGMALFDSIEAQAASYEKAKAEAERYKAAVDGLVSGLERLGMDAYLDIMTSLGEAFAAGGDGADSFKASMADLGRQILQSLPELMLMAGVQLLGTPAWAIGLGLILGSGIVAIGAGAAGAASTENAHGNVYDQGGLVPFARGGVVSRPTVFPFASGVGLMGEAGPEAILPLERGASGDLGVKATVSPVNIQIFNQAPGVEVSQEERTGPNQEREIRVMIRKVVQDAAASGDLDGVMGYRYGLSPRGRRATG